MSMRCIWSVSPNHILFVHVVEDQQPISIIAEPPFDQRDPIYGLSDIWKAERDGDLTKAREHPFFRRRLHVEHAAVLKAVVVCVFERKLGLAHACQPENASFPEVEVVSAPKVRVEEQE